MVFALRQFLPGRARRRFRNNLYFNQSILARYHREKVRRFYVSTIIGPNSKSLLQRLCTIILRVVRRFHHVVIENRNRDLNLSGTVRVITMRSATREGVLERGGVTLFSTIGPNETRLVLGSFPTMVIYTNVALNSGSNLNMPIIRRVLYGRNTTTRVVHPRISMIMLHFKVNIGRSRVFIRLPTRLLMFLFIRSRSSGAVRVPSKNGLYRPIHVLIVTVSRRSVVSISVNYLFCAERGFYRGNVTREESTISAIMTRRRSGSTKPFTNRLAKEYVQSVTLLIRGFQGFSSRFLKSFFNITIRRVKRNYPTCAGLVYGVLRALRNYSCTPYLVDQGAGNFRHGRVVFVRWLRSR